MKGTTKATNLRHFICFGTFLFLPIFFLLASCSGPDGTGEKSNKPVSEKAHKSSINPEKGRQVFQTCVACHGEKGTGLREMNGPSLVNLPARDIEKQVLSFKNGWRGYHSEDTIGKTMALISQTLSEEDIFQVAAYIETLPKENTSATISGGNIREGESRYNMICGACHGSQAKGNTSLEAPKLTGLDDWYLFRQLILYRDGLRGTHPNDRLGAQMTAILPQLKDEQAILNVVAYLQSLQEEAMP